MRQSSTSGRLTATGPDGGKRRKTTADGAAGRPPNRGIVFAAFRLPRPDGSSKTSTAEELEALHADAEVLVDMCIDIHRREPPPGTARRCVTAGGMAGPAVPLVTF